MCEQEQRAADADCWAKGRCVMTASGMQQPLQFTLEELAKISAGPASTLGSIDSLLDEAGFHSGVVMT